MIGVLEIDMYITSNVYYGIITAGGPDPEALVLASELALRCHPGGCGRVCPSWAPGSVVPVVTVSWIFGIPYIYIYTYRPNKLKWILDLCICINVYIYIYVHV